MVVDLFKIITTTFKEQKTGPEILEWITGAGQKAFAEKFLVPLGEAYQAHLQREQKREKPEPLRMKANLNADPSLPFDGAKFEGNKGEKHLRQGEVELEYRSDEDELYVNRRNLVPFLSDKQLDGKTVKGFKLHPEAEANSPTNATLADVLYAHQEFIPKKYRDRVWFFWATIFSGADGNLFVRSLYWGGERWSRGYVWLGDDWYERDPSASLAKQNLDLEVKSF
ncbi:MAG: hypothetical protein UY03_C0016G0010 [Parcubacteria group bacterium GW2011_GWA2_47_64]|nr:MAG: hypothetical protein UY03_C0016G0010 [Parcubacteria group bacterium GW2011_GWA2_47_64]KKU96501.1 MAG: hypothetical protein UY29_C0010G0006 [Parcubacteria group bacterium GW2011_GWC2_48_17]